MMRGMHAAQDTAAENQPDRDQASADTTQDATRAGARPRRNRRVIRPGTEVEAVSGVSGDETPAGWSESSAAHGDSNDDQLRRDVPPHW